MTKTQTTSESGQVEAGAATIEPCQDPKHLAYAEFVRNRYLEQGWTQREIAEHFGLTQSGFRKIFTVYKTPCYRHKLFPDICELLNIRDKDLEQLDWKIKGTKPYEFDDIAMAPLLKPGDLLTKLHSQPRYSHLPPSTLRAYDGQVSQYCYRVIMPDNSLKHYIPVRSHVLIDPTVAPSNDDFVLVAYQNTELQFREYQQESHQVFLINHSTQRSTQMGAEQTILGVIISASIERCFKKVGGSDRY